MCACACVSLVPTCSDHRDEPCRTLVPDGSAAHMSGGGTKTRQLVWLLSPLLSLSFSSLVSSSSSLLFSRCRPAALLSFLGSKSKSRRLVRCRIFDKSSQCSQRPRTNSSANKGGFYDTGWISREFVWVHVHMRTGAWSQETESWFHPSRLPFIFFLFYLLGVRNTVCLCAPLCECAALTQPVPLHFWIRCK